MVTRSMSGPVVENCALKSMDKVWRWSLQVMESMKAPRADVVSYNSTMDNCSLGGQWEKALHLFEAMSWCRNSPTLVSLHAAASGCEAWGQWRKALSLLPRREAADVVTFNTAMNASLHSTKERRGIVVEDDTSKSQAWRRSLEYLTNLSSTGLREDLVTVNLASAAFAAGRRWEQALCWHLQSCGPPGSIFLSVSEGGLSPDEVTYGALLGARFPRHLALQMLQSMRQQALEPNAVTHSAVISACERDGDPSGAPGSLWGLAGTAAALSF